MNELAVQNTTKQVDQLVRDLARLAVGFEHTIRMLDQVRAASHSGYPPYDLETVSDNHYRLSMAVAGFTEADLDITLADSVLSIQGKIGQHTNKVYLYKGIASRGFRREFCLNSWVKIISCELIDGILMIDFVQELPVSPVIKFKIGHRDVIGSTADQA